MNNKLIKELEAEVRILKESNESYSTKLHKIEDYTKKHKKELPEIYYQIHSIIYSWAIRT